MGWNQQTSLRGPTWSLFLSGLSARTSSGVEYCVNAVIHKTNGQKQVNFIKKKSRNSLVGY